MASGPSLQVFLKSGFIPDLLVGRQSDPFVKSVY